MSWSERFVQNHKRQTDCAISRAYRQLASDPCALKTFHKLLMHARCCALRLFEAPMVDGRHLGIEALVNLSRFGDDYIRSIEEWPGTALCWRLAVVSLAHHLLAKFKIPRFLAAAWYATDAMGEQKRRWFIAHSRGQSFRSLHLPMPMTRKMERIFLASADHLPVEQAIRQAELMALAMPAAFAREILATDLASDLRHGEFWRTVWLFLIANSDEVHPSQIGPMIDYIQAIRHNRPRFETAQGIVERGPPSPAFSIKGRTIQSLQRLMNDWHRSLGTGVPTLIWRRSHFQPFFWEETHRDLDAPRQWQIVELTDSAQLRSEGAALHHCVASYAWRCSRGLSSIWSLRVWQEEKMRRVLTVEVDPQRRAIIQVRGMANRTASGRPRRIVEEWAIRERLQVLI